MHCRPDPSRSLLISSTRGRLRGNRAGRRGDMTLKRLGTFLSISGFLTQGPPEVAWVFQELLD